MITKRIIPCLDVRDGRVVKGVNFEGLRDVSSPVELGMYYSSCGADELVFYDITASSDGRKLFTDILCETARKVFIPLTVGGGINTVEDFDRVLKCGADELVFYDITASSDGRKLFTDILRETASKVFIPLTVGGGINTVEDFDRVLKCGADKVSVNSGAIRNRF